ncbi:MAG TPA: glycosyltransferase [Anaerolineaceae bacterium]|nr:glycosyltransferase [Anaerolineaceae bacterium]
MRIGQNPAKQKIAAYEPKRLGIASLIFIPHLEGYYAQVLKILELQLKSLRVNTSEPFDMLVFDNGSIPEVQQKLQELQRSGLIDWLILSNSNLGKTGALNWILAAMPNEIIGFTDSDVYFRPGWLEESLKRLNGSALVGVVTAQPCFADVLNGEERAFSSLSENGIEIQNYWPPNWAVQEFVHGLGGSEEMLQRFLKTPLHAVEFGDDKIKAVLGASHMQFILRRELARSVIPLPAQFGLSAEEDRVFNQRVDAEGFLHVSLPEPLVVHMGNALDEHLEEEIRRQLDSSPDLSEKAPHPGNEPADARLVERILRKGARKPWFKRQLTRIYNLLFKILAES